MRQQPRSRPYPMSHQHHANATSNTPNRQGPCYKCGGAHYLRNCPNATPEERERIYRQHGGQMRTRRSNNRNHRNRIPVNKEDLHFKPPEPEELVKLIQLLDHQLPQEHKELMQYKEQLPMQQSELHLIHLLHGLQPMQ